MDKAKAKLQAKQDEIQARIESNQKETGAKIKSLQERAAKQTGERKAKREVRLAELQTDKSGAPTYLIKHGNSPRKLCPQNDKICTKYCSKQYLCCLLQYF